MSELFRLATQKMTYQPSKIDQRKMSYALFFQQGTHLDLPEVDAILPCEFLKLDCVDHLLDQFLKTQRNITNRMVDL